jgi:hypothetical protein
VGRAKVQHVFATPVGADPKGVLFMRNVRTITGASFAAIGACSDGKGGTGANPQASAWAMLLAGFGRMGITARRRVDRIAYVS